MSQTEKCPCGSSESYVKCCGRYHAGEALPPTAEALMRARYSAYVKDRIDFVERTSDPRHRDSFDREASEAWARESEWLGLEVVATREGQEGDASGEVEFKARYRRNGEELTHHEVSLFTHFPAGGGWNYTDGREIREPIRNAMKTGRNDPCPCGSGKKFKKCCG